MIRDLVPFNNGSLFNEFQNEFAKMEKLMNNIFSDSGSFLGVGKATFPKYNLIETDNDYVIEVAAAGLGKEDLEVRVDDNKLVIRGKKKSKYDNAKYHIRELASRSFEKRINLPSIIDKDKIKAKFEEGILEINLPKAEKNEGSVRQVTIK